MVRPLLILLVLVSLLSTAFAITNNVRIICEPAGQPWEYYKEIQVDYLDPGISCPTHPTAPTRDFVVEWVEY